MGERNRLSRVSLLDAFASLFEAVLGLLVIGLVALNLLLRELANMFIQLVLTIVKLLYKGVSKVFSLATKNHRAYRAKNATRQHLKDQLDDSKARRNTSKREKRQSRQSKNKSKNKTKTSLDRVS